MLRRPSGPLAGPITGAPRRIDSLSGWTHRTEGKIFVVAGKPGKTTVTATTTDGHHAAQCVVTVR